MLPPLTPPDCAVKVTLKWKTLTLEEDQRELGFAYRKPAPKAETFDRVTLNKLVLVTTTGSVC